jgi:hypothetical protein
MEKVVVGRPRDGQRCTTLANAHGSEAEAKAESYSAANGGRRGAMIVDVVASRQRKSAGES